MSIYLLTFYIKTLHISLSILYQYIYSLFNVSRIRLFSSSPLVMTIFEPLVSPPVALASALTLLYRRLRPLLQNHFLEKCLLCDGFLLLVVLVELFFGINFTKGQFLCKWRNDLQRLAFPLARSLWAQLRDLFELENRRLDFWPSSKEVLSEFS